MAVIALSDPSRVTAQTPSTSTTCCPGLDQEVRDQDRSHNKRCHKGDDALLNLSAAERQQLKEDLKKIHGDPKLATERATVKGELKLLHQQAHALLLAADPTIKPVLDKMEQSRKSRCHHSGCEGDKR